MLNTNSLFLTVKYLFILFLLLLLPVAICYGLFSYFTVPKICSRSAAIFQSENKVKPGQLVVSTSTIDTNSPAHGVIKSVVVQKPYLYLTVGPKIVVLDISNPTALTKLGQIVFPTDSDIRGLQFKDKKAYFLLYKNLWIVDFSNPTAPQVVSSSPIPWNPIDMVMNQNYVYISDAQCRQFCPYCTTVCGGGLHIIDVSNPEAPIYSNCYEAFGTLNDIGISQSHLYAYFKHYSMQTRKNHYNTLVMEVSDPIAPVEIDTLELQYTANIKIVDEYAYVTSGSQLRILDISHPSQPKQIGFYKKNTGVILGIEIEGVYAYIFTLCTSRCLGLRIIDISNPTTPVEVGFYKTSYIPNSLAVADGYAYLVETPKYNSDMRRYENNKLRVLNVSNPSMISEVGIYVFDSFGNLVH